VELTLKSSLFLNSPYLKIVHYQTQFEHEYKMLIAVVEEIFLYKLHDVGRKTISGVVLR